MELEEAIRSSLEILFPLLAQSGYRLTSPMDKQYNCIAWSVGITQDWIWPVGGSEGNFVWPDGVPREETIPAFIAAFAVFGYTLTTDDRLTPAIEKIALYALGDIPTHAAKQLPNGLWSSKLGRFVDIEHTLGGLIGVNYGAVVHFFQRPAVISPE